MPKLEEEILMRQQAIQTLQSAQYQQAMLGRVDYLRTMLGRVGLRLSEVTIREEISPNSYHLIATKKIPRHMKTRYRDDFEETNKLNPDEVEELYEQYLIHADRSRKTKTAAWAMNYDGTLLDGEYRERKRVTIEGREIPFTTLVRVSTPTPEHIIQTLRGLGKIVEREVHHHDTETYTTC